MQTEDVADVIHKEMKDEDECFESVNKTMSMRCTSATASLTTEACINIIIKEDAQNVTP